MVKLRCVYCNEGEVTETELPCTCPHCGRKLTRVVRGALEELMAREDCRGLGLAGEGQWGASLGQPERTGKPPCAEHRARVGHFPLEAGPEAVAHDHGGRARRTGALPHLVAEVAPRLGFGPPLAVAPAQDARPVLKLSLVLLPGDGRPGLEGLPMTTPPSGRPAAAPPPAGTPLRASGAAAPAPWPG